jgi:hypothetical protein
LAIVKYKVNAAAQKLGEDGFFGFWSSMYTRIDLCQP